MSKNVLINILTQNGTKNILSFVKNNNSTYTMEHWNKHNLREINVGGNLYGHTPHIQIFFYIRGGRLGFNTYVLST